MLDKTDENEKLDNETSLNVIVNFQNGELNFFFTNLSGYWYLNSIAVDACNITDTFQLRDIYAPIRFSYHCNNAVFTSENNTVLTMPGFQVHELTFFTYQVILTNSSLILGSNVHAQYG